METRTMPRVDIDLTIACEIDKEMAKEMTLTGGNKFEVKAVDISEIGIGVSSEYFLPKGVIVDLNIAGTSFGLNENIRPKGEVRYCKFVKASKYKYKCGIKFLDLPEKQRKIIAQFIAKYERRQSHRMSLE